MTPEQIAAINAASSSLQKPYPESKKISEQELLRLVRKLPPEVREVLLMGAALAVAAKLIRVLHLDQE